MATRFSNALIIATDTAAHIQAWATFIDALLVTTGGWVNTTDTGQTAPGSLPVPTLANQSVGYRIYHMNDALQATAPVFLRIDFGTGANASIPAIFLTIGTGSDGTGIITGRVLGQTQFATNNWSAAQANNSYGSADVNRYSFALGINATTSTIYWVNALERSKDLSGNDTGDGLILIWSDVTPRISGSLYIVATPGPQPVAESGVSYILTIQNPSQVFTPPGTTGIGLIIPFKGAPVQPGMNVVVANSSDVAAEASFSMTLYGATRTYQQVRMQLLRQGQGTVDANGRVCIRYD